ncbi:flavoprotein [Cantharellus anzutake]|uniref:flavoprotein n=1 Tax=Cantharellus anzutake TaxID=1750568 RepID=UPI00190319F1|nr:flavoprotein [Cantharellus anzutake]KAF8333074.1 flavoprotein [Cantharellus anzutake]
MTLESTGRGQLTKRTFEAASNRVAGCLHVLLITTGSVASVKAPLIVEGLLQYSTVRVQVASSKPSLAFFNRNAVESQHQNEGVKVWTDDDEWESWGKIGDPILHIELRRWADVVLIAPCSANTMAKIANGICDNLVTSLLRALAPTTPTIVFPAMNTLMYEHPLTAVHLKTIKEVIGYEVIACGEIGVGAMTEWRDIVRLVATRWHLVKEEAESAP